jgi:hypothetical protein
MSAARKLVQAERPRDTSFHGAARNERAYRNSMLVKAEANPFVPFGGILVVPGFNDKRYIYGHEWTIARILAVCSRRRSLSFIDKQRGFLRRWLRRWEPGVLKYLRAVDQEGNWHDLRTRKHGVASRAYSTVPVQSPEVNGMILLAAVAEEIGAVGNFWVGDPIPEPEPTPLPMPNPETDKEGSGEGGSVGTAGSAAGMPKPRPEDDTAAGPRVIDLTEEELAALLDDVSMPGMGGMF